MKKWLFNPFTYIAGTKALLIGLVVMLATAVIAFFSHAHFDGAIDCHFGATAPFINYLIEPLVDWICLVISLYVIGRVASESSIRFIDMAGTIALARWPLFFTALCGFIPVPPIDVNAPPMQLLTQIMTLPFIIQTLLALPLIVWFIVLLYNAFAVSANMKGGKSAGAFIGGVIIAEIISKVILHYL